MPKFHGLMLVRDEDDIIAQTLRHLLSWIDTIWIFDTGSTDQTYAILQSIAKSDRRVRLLGSEDVVFNEALRAVLFDEARSSFADGDWVVRLDADEFYHVPPPEFVSRFAKRTDGRIDLKWYYFRLTDREVTQFQNGAVAVEDERKRPITERRRYYKITSHREPRLFKYRSSMRFHKANNAPFYGGIVCDYRIPVRHYPHRDPVQMEKRFRIRAGMKKKGSRSSSHWDNTDWTREVVALEGGTSHADSALAREPGHDDDVIRFWRLGEELPNIIAREPTEVVWKNVVKRAFYSGPVRLADMLKPGFGRKRN